MRSFASRGLLLASTAWMACASLGVAQEPAEEHSPAQPVDAKVAADPGPDLQAEYRAVADAAIAEFDAGRFAEARALFLRAHELWPSARTLRTLGMTAFELRQYPSALAELQAALDDPRRPLAETERAQVQRLLEQTRAFVGHYRVRVMSAESELSVDGAPFERVADVGLVLAVGEHQLLVRAPGHLELRRSLVVQGREEQELVLSLHPAPSPPQNAGAAADARPEVVAIARPTSAPVDRSSADRDTDHTPAIVAFVVAGRRSASAASAA
jgi:tetratricopeptide (TPR) repeat protein